MDGNLSQATSLRIKRYPSPVCALRIVATFPNYEFPGEREESIADLTDEKYADA